MKHIKREEVSEVRDYKLEKILGVKGAITVAEFIKQSIKTKKIKVACIGEPGTGKTLVLKVLLNELGYVEESETCDNIKSKEDFEYATSNKCKYFTSACMDITELVDRLEETSNCNISENYLVLDCVKDNNGERYVKAVYEITTINNDMVVKEIVVIHKERYRIIDEV